MVKRWKLPKSAKFLETITLQKFSTMFRSASLDRYASNDGATLPMRMDSASKVQVNKDSEDQHFQTIDMKTSELERDLVAKTNILDEAKVLVKLGNSNYIGKSKQEKVSYLKAREAKLLIAATQEEILALTAELLTYIVSFPLCYLFISQNTANMQMKNNQILLAIKVRRLRYAVK
jgi:DNA-binding CsgD family transcriptional regulator